MGNGCSCFKSQERELLPIGGDSSFAIQPKDVNRATNNFSDEYRIGRGGFGEVYRADLDQHGHVAIKRIKKDLLSMEDERECKLLSDYQHPNLVRFHTALVVDNHLCIVMELVANGSLRIMLKNEGGNLDYKIRLNICKGIAKGINYLHTAYSTHLVHRDIKTDNVLLTKDYTAKICDFGLGKILCEKFNSETVITSHICGTEAYLPPEALQGKVLRRLDIYSYGVVLLEILSGKSPLYNGSEKCRFLVGLFHLHYNHNRTAFPIDETANWPNDYKRGLMELAKWCLKTKYRKRPLMNQVIIELEKISSRNVCA